MTPAALPDVEGQVATYREHRGSRPHTISRDTTWLDVMRGRGKKRALVRIPRVTWSCDCGEEWPECPAGKAFLRVCKTGKMHREHWTLHAAGRELAAVCTCNGGKPVELVGEEPAPPQAPPPPQHEGEFPSGWREPCFCGSDHQTRKCAKPGSAHHTEHLERLRVREEREAARDPRKRPLVWDPSGRKGGKFVPKTREAAERQAEIRREAFAYLDRVDQALERAREKDRKRRERAAERRAAKRAGKDSGA